MRNIVRNKCVDNFPDLLMYKFRNPQKILLTLLAANTLLC